MSDNVAAEYKDIMAAGNWPQVFQTLCREAQKFGYTCVEARKPENKALNRYRDVNPYDHTRIILKRGPVNYINANLVKMEKVGRQYILTQGPLPDTVGHFWLMIWEQKSTSILMLNKIIEKNEIKCHMYWPAAEGEEHKMTLHDVGLTVQLMHQEDLDYYSSRSLRLEDIETGSSRDILQFHYTTWPDFGVPSSPHAFLKFLEHVRASGSLKPEAGPPVVHCSAGIGRSGTFCLVDACLVLLERGIENIKVQEILLEMRRDRMGLVQTPDQLRFVYMAIIEGKKRLSPDWDGIVDVPPLAEEAEELPPPPPPRSASLPQSNPLLDRDTLPQEPSSDSSSDTDSGDDHDEELSNDDGQTPNSHTFSSPHFIDKNHVDKATLGKEAAAQEKAEKKRDAGAGKRGFYSFYTPLAVAVLVGAIAFVYNYYNN